MASWTPALLSSVVEQFPFGIALLDLKGSVFYVNSIFQKIAQLEPLELMGQGLYDRLFSQPEVRDRLQQKALSAIESPFDDLDLTAIVGSESEKRNLHFCGGSVTGPSGACLVLTIQDVTHRKAFEKVIESSFDNFIQVTNALDDAMKKIGEQNSILEEYKEKMTRELAIAKGVQKAIIPREFPKRAGFTMYGVAIPTDELGGDYFDWFDVDDDRVGLLIADVSGHGVPSSLITTMVKSSFDFHTKRHPDPATVLSEVNRDLTAIIADTGFYLTAFYGVLHVPSREFRVALAGHDAPYCLSGGVLSRLGGNGEGTILGVFPEAKFESEVFRLAPVAKILAITDGIVEARAEGGEFFGSERLEAFLLTQSGQTSRHTVEALVEETDRFFDGKAPNDDRTLLVFDVFGSENTVDWLHRAKESLVQKHPQQALDAVERFWENADRDAESCFLAGQSLAFLNRSEEASEMLEEAVHFDSRHYRAWYYLGLVRHNGGDRAGARTSWIRVREIKPDYKDLSTLLGKDAEL